MSKQTIKFQCPACKKVVEMPGFLFGKEFACQCGSKYVVDANFLAYAKPPKSAGQKIGRGLLLFILALVLFIMGLGGLVIFFR